MFPRSDQTALGVIPTPITLRHSPALPPHWTCAGAHGLWLSLTCGASTGFQSIPRNGGGPDPLLWVPAWAAQAAEEGISLIRLLGPVALLHFGLVAPWNCMYIDTPLQVDVFILFYF